MGADNLVEQMLRMGLSVVRVGKASSVSTNLWDYTLDDAIAKDPDAQRAIQEASKASLKLRNLSGAAGRNKSKKNVDVDGFEERRIRDKATEAVKASIKVYMYIFYRHCHIFSPCPLTNYLSKLSGL